ncbi:class I SAM-dependent methyltransferase [Altererythrobacter fulvus]|uniref:class I SAM-dependent methyltransferase n=1 Tax=Caenibius fulvus TaxID=2126012 RepID=UPI003016CFF7
MASHRVAEHLPLAQLRPLWAGLDKEPVFFSYRRCAICGLLYNPVYFTAHALADLYSELAPNMDMVPRSMIEATQRGYFDAIARAGELAGDYLEIGPDVGHMTAEAARRGSFGHFWLYEPNRAVHSLLRATAGTGAVTLESRMDDLSAVPEGAVGLAVMVHVLDHLLDPLPLLTQIRAKLRPGGMLAIVTHNEASLLRRILGRKWPPFCLQHPQLFSPATMKTVLQRAGLERVEVTGSSNLFPSDFLVRQGAQAVGVPLGKVSLPSFPVRLPLGNILTLARAPG